MEVIITDNYESMSKLAASIIRQQLLCKPNSVLGLATGSTPVGTYKELARLHREEGLDGLIESPRLGETDRSIDLRLLGPPLRAGEQAGPKLLEMVPA